MDKLPHGIGFLIGVLLFGLFYGSIYFATFRHYGAVSPSSGPLGLVLGIAFGMIGEAVAEKLRDRK